VDNSHTRVTVKRIEKIPVRYYVQETKPRPITGKVKVEINPALLTEHKRLSDALVAPVYTEANCISSRAAFLRELIIKAKSGFVGGFKGLQYYLSENLKRLCVSGAISAGVACSACAILLCTCSVAYTITVNGEEIGTVQNKAVYNQVLEAIQEEVAYVSDGGFTPGGAPEFSGKLIPKNAFTSMAELKEQLKATSRDMVPAYGVYMGDEIVFALPNKEAAIAVLEDYKNSFVEDGTNATASFCGDVTVAYSFVPKSSLKSRESAMEALQTGRIITHELKAGETLEFVASAYGVTVQDLLAVNPITDAENPGVSELNICTGEPLLGVKTVEHSVYSEVIPFNSIKKVDPEKYQGRTYVEQKGCEGEKAVEAYITKINGVETKRDVVSENVLKASVDEILTEGTKEPPSHIGTGSFVVPTGGGTLSSRYGARWGRQHKGIDIAAPTGTEIYAADNGTVTYSQFNDGGYGYMMKIDHGNGIMTYYAHCSELLVPEGTVVAKGELIARVGNTGRSTGAHLHFEVLVDGETTDPLTYITSLQ